MARTGRGAVDQSDFATTGIKWLSGYVLDAGAPDTVLDPANPSGYYDFYTFDTGYNLPGGGNDGRVTIWGQGLASFGQVTLAQQHFMTAASRDTDPQMFPGSYFALGNFGVTQSSYGYIQGVRDFTPTVTFPSEPFDFFPATLDYSLGDAIDVTYIYFGFGLNSSSGRLYLNEFGGAQGNSSSGNFTSDFSRTAISGTPQSVAPKTGGAGVDRLTAGETASYDYNADMLIKPASLQNRLAGGTALSLDGHFDFRENANIGSSTVTPHASVRAEWSGGREAYSFTVHPSDAGTLVTFDIDETDEIDTVLRLYQSNGTPVTLSFGGTTGLVADDSTVDSGSNISLDSFATARLAPGTYIIEVGRYEDRQFTTPAAYTLHVSFDKAEITTNLENAMEGGVAQGFAGNDVILSGAGDDTLDGGADNDTVSFENASQGVIASLFLGAASGHGDDRLTSFENLIGSDFGDTLLGNAGPNRINGRAGDDVLEGRGDNDTLDGGDGNDTAVFSGNRSAYTVTAEAGGFRLVDTRSGTNDGSDLALNIEVFKFADSTVAAGSLLPNAAPTAPATKAVTTLEDTASALTAIGAADADGDLLTYSIKVGTAPTKGSVAFSGGSFTYTPSANANGPDSFTIRIQDSKGASVEQRVSVTITPVNDIPDAVNDGGLVTPYQTALVTSAATLLGNDTDADGDALSIQSVQGAAHGSVGLVAGNVTFTPDAGYSGSASYTYTISDGRGGLDTATVNLTVTPPRATAQAIMTPGQSFGVTGFQGLPTDVFISGTAAGHETITVGDFTTATFSNNFTAGGDTIRLAGRASEFSISVSGNLVSLASTINEAVLKLPVGFNTTTIVFETAPGVFSDSRVLKFFADGADADSAPDLFLGAQRVMPDVAALPITAFA